MAKRSVDQRPSQKAASVSLVLPGKNVPLPDDTKTKFELMGVSQLEKKVASSIKCGRIYLPLDWVGKRVKIIRMD